MLFCNPSIHPSEKGPWINSCTELEKAGAYVHHTGTNPFHQKQQSVFAHEGSESRSYRQEEILDSATIPSSGLPECSSLIEESPSSNTCNHEKDPINFQEAGIFNLHSWGMQANEPSAKYFNSVAPPYANV